MHKNLHEDIKMKEVWERSKINVCSQPEYDNWAFLEMLPDEFQLKKFETMHLASVYTKMLK